MEILNEKSLVSTLIKEFPEFETYKEFHSNELDNTTIILSDFGLFLLKNIEEKNESDPLTKKSIEFLNRMINSSDKELINHAQVNILEQLVSSKKVIKLLKKNLSEGGLMLLRQSYEHFSSFSDSFDNL